MNKKKVIPGAEKASFFFEELDTWTRQVVELHHPGVRVRLDRGFGAYYEGERENFHLGVSEHCDWPAALVEGALKPYLAECDFFLCGPPPFLADMSAALKAAGARSIHLDVFGPALAQPN